MKTIFNKGILFLALTISPPFMFTSCSSSSNDDGDTTVQTPKPDSTIKELLGTYKGTLKVFDGGVKTYYDAEIIFSSAGEKTVRIAPKKDQPYSIVTVKDLPLTTQSGTYYISQNAQGIFNYESKSKFLILLTEKTAETDIAYSFEGNKI